MNATLANTHTQTLNGLLSSVSYFYQVISKDAAGNKAASQTQQFTTLSASDTPHLIFLNSEEIPEIKRYIYPGEIQRTQIFRVFESDFVRMVDFQKGLRMDLYSGTLPAPHQKKKDTSMLILLTERSISMPTLLTTQAAISQKLSM